MKQDPAVFLRRLNLGGTANTAVTPCSQNLGGDSPFLPPHDLRHCVDVAHGGISSSTMKLVSATIGSATGSASLMTLVSAMTGSSSPIFSTVKDSLGLRDDEKKTLLPSVFLSILSNL